MSNKPLIVYYSLTGNTKLIAEAIKGVIDADILALKPIKELNPEKSSRYFWGGYQANMKKKPKLMDLSVDPTRYDTIIIGTPVWAYNYTPAIRSFIAQVTLENKKMAVFCCHEGGPGKTLLNLKKDLSGNTIIAENDFLNVAKNKEENIKKARQWAMEIKEKL